MNEESITLTQQKSFVVEWKKESKFFVRCFLLLSCPMRQLGLGQMSEVRTNKGGHDVWEGHYTSIQFNSILSKT